MKYWFYLSLLICLSACGSQEAGVQFDHVFDHTSNRTSVQVQVGDDFAVVLYSNPSTGYHWRAKDDLPDAVSFQGDSYKQKPGTEGQNGAGGKITFSYRAIKAGTVKIEREYIAPSNDSVAETFVLEVEILAKEE